MASSRRSRRTGSIVKPDRSKGSTCYGLRFYDQTGTRRHVTSTATTATEAERQLELVLAEVKLGIWRPKQRKSDQRPAQEEPAAGTPTFHEYASRWLEGRRHEIRPRTLESLTWQLSNHLLPAFADRPVDRIAIADVDGFKLGKLRERERNGTGLGNGSINRCLTTLASILDAATEDGYRDGENPARGKRRRLKQERPSRSFLEIDQLRALLAAATDAEHAALIATMALGGLRVGEATGLRWRDIDLAGSRLTVRASKTDAGVRTVPVLPWLHDLLAEHKARTADTGDDQLVFRTKNGTPRGRMNVTRNILQPATRRANRALEQAGRRPIEHASCHSLRRTFISTALSAGAPIPWVMKAAGHTSPTMTLGVYAQAMSHDDGALASIDELLRGDDATRAETSGRNDDATIDAALAELLDDH